jgi:hypothetical protein
MWRAMLAGLTAAFLAPAGMAQDVSIAGVWRSAVEGQPSGTSPYPSASDVQTLYLGADGRYRREIVVEGGDGVRGAGGTIIDTGSYRFIPPETFQYSRQSWSVCTFAGCGPGTPIGPNAGSLPFRMIGPGRALFIGLSWTKIQ